MSSEVKANKVSPASGTDFTFGDSGDTFTVPSGATIANSGTATGFGDDNTPSFMGYLDTNQNLTDDTYTLISFNQEAYDSDSAFDTTTGKFTVPAGEGGKYWIAASVRYDDQTLNSTSDVTTSTLNIYKNGAQSNLAHFFSVYGGYGRRMTHYTGGILTLSAADYLQVYVRNNFNPTYSVQAFGDSGTWYTYFTGWKLIL